MDALSHVDAHLEVNICAVSAPQSTVSRDPHKQHMEGVRARHKQHMEGVRAAHKQHIEGIRGSVLGAS